jgi:hypothetical protein
MAEGRSSRRGSVVALRREMPVGIVIAVCLTIACRPSQPVQTVPESEVPSVKSADLKRTSVVVTLDDPLPDHHNVIWCATFQMAWDKAKRNVIKEPIRIIGADALAERLNRGEFPPADIGNESFYAAAGFVKDGIIEEVQREMAGRFPSESIPPFDPAYKTLPKAFLGYSFLSVSVPFKYAFETSKDAFVFTDSNTTQTRVTSFDAPQGYDPMTEKTRAQVEVLYSEITYPASGRTSGFAIDLCKDSKPYQVVLTCMPREETLRATVAAAEKRIAAFHGRKDYGVLRSLQPTDNLTVPDVLYRLTHRYSELIGHGFANPAFLDCFVLEATQMVDFRLTRTGVILKSEARFGGAGGGMAPRHFRFDRPFLIYVKKRQPDAKPFFVMWVDNAELMKPFYAQPGNAPR